MVEDTEENTDKLDEHGQEAEGSSTEPPKKGGMIWLRRILTIPLVLVLLLLLLVALVIQEVGGTFLDPGYYPKLLRKSNAYEFLLVDVMTSALDEARELDKEDLPEELDENPLVTLGLSTEEIVSSINRAIPPDYVQDIVEQVFEEVGRYVAGERDEFTVTIQAGEQVETLVQEVKALLRKADAYSLLYEELVTPAIEDAVVEELPFGLEISGDRIVTSVRRVAPPEWVQSNVESALDELTPYVVGNRDTFEVSVQLSDRVVIALEEVKALLRESDVYDLLYDEVIGPQVQDSLGGIVELPFGITVTNDEVLSALRRVAPPEWVEEQAERVIDEASPYLTGRSETLDISISLADNKREARDVIVETVIAKFTQAANELPKCTRGQTLGQMLSGGSQRLPECIPAGVQPNELVDFIGNNVVVAAVDPLVLGAIPDTIRFTETNLREALRIAGAEDNIELVDDVREIVRDGWSYTQADLQEDLRETFNGTGQGEDAIEALDDVRAFLADGWTYTEVDFREHIVEATDEDTLDDFDSGRDYFSLARTLRLLIYLPVLLLLVTVGFLGGRGWAGRFAWAAGSLVVTSAIIFVAFGPVYNVVGESQLEDGREKALSEIEVTGDFENTQRLVIDKLFDIGELVINGFASGMATKALILVIVGLVGLGVALRWADVVVIVRRVRHRIMQARA